MNNIQDNEQNKDEWEFNEVESGRYEIIIPDEQMDEIRKPSENYERLLGDQRSILEKVYDKLF